MSSGESAFLALQRRLEEMSWGDAQQWIGECESILRIAAEPGTLAGMMSLVAAREQLLGLSEEQRWGFKVVLCDVKSGARLRLHVWKAGSRELPHSHRWPFAARILAGSYEHCLFGTEAEMEHGTMGRPVMVRTEVPGSTYALDTNAVHSTSPGVDAVSLIVRGPSTKRRSIQTDPSTGSIRWKYGATDETARERDAVRFSGEALAAVVGTLGRLGLIDSRTG